MVGYEIFDEIICITLKCNVERQNLVKKTFKQIGILPTFYVAKKSPRGGRIGCFESHLNVINECYNKGAERILIFEDDVITTPGYSTELINEACTFMKNNQDWDIFQLGYEIYDIDNGFFGELLSYIASEKVGNTQNIYKFFQSTTHSYCLSRSGMRILLKYSYYLNNLDDEVPHFDVIIKKNSKTANYKCYGIAPMLFTQRWCLKSDNIAFSKLEKIFRNFICVMEISNFGYINSLLLAYRYTIFFILSKIMLLFIK